MNPTGIGGAKPGEARNPSGRPKGAVKFRLYAEKKTKTGKSLINFWLETYQNAQAPYKDRLKASELLAGYAFGKPTQAVTGEDGAPIQIQVENKSQVDSEGFKRAFEELLSARPESNGGSNGHGLPVGSGNGHR